LILALSIGALAYGISNGTVKTFSGGGDRAEWHHNQANGHLPPDLIDDVRYESRSKELFKFAGQVAVFAGLFSFVWIMMKRQIKTKVGLVKQLVKWNYQFHDWVGWLAVVLVAAHATYFLWTKFNERGTWDGIAATLPLLALAGYGYVMKKSRDKKIMRKIHFSLAVAFLVAMLFHAGGTVIQATVLTVFVYGGIVVFKKVVERGL
jgi:predicted ferric reductase